MKNIIITIVLIAIVGLVGYFFLGGEEDMVIEDEPLIEEEINTEEVSENTEAGIYEDYAPEKLAFADTGSVVLFFHATWCPSCRVLEKDIDKNSSEIPVDVAVLKLDYDEETELKKKYGVTTQHTLVQVDSEGKLIQKWSGGSSLESVLKNL